MGDWSKLRSTSLINEKDKILKKYGHSTMPESVQKRLSKIDRLLDKVLDIEHGVVESPLKKKQGGIIKMNSGGLAQRGYGKARR